MVYVRAILYRCQLCGEEFTPARTLESAPDGDAYIGVDLPHKCKDGCIGNATFIGLGGKLNIDDEIKARLAVNNYELVVEKQNIQSTCVFCRIVTNNFLRYECKATCAKDKFPVCSMCLETKTKGEFEHYCVEYYRERRG